jgi:hypothetical protein
VECVGDNTFQDNFDGVPFGPVPANFTDAHPYDIVSLECPLNCGDGADPSCRTNCPCWGFDSVEDYRVNSDGGLSCMFRSNSGSVFLDSASFAGSSPFEQFVADRRKAQIPDGTTVETMTCGRGEGPERGISVQEYQACNRDVLLNCISLPLGSDPEWAAGVPDSPLCPCWPNEEDVGPLGGGAYVLITADF